MMTISIVQTSFPNIRERTTGNEELIDGGLSSLGLLFSGELVSWNC
jgi:hypothetical protein